MSLWDWAVAAFSRPGVEEVCLILQDREDQCVSLLLWAAWRGPIDAEMLEAAVDTARSWHEVAIAPLREVRRTLKKPVSDMGDGARLSLRERVRSVELAAERGLLEELERLSGPSASGPAASGDVLRGMAAASRLWSGRTPRAELITLAGRLC